MPQTEAPATNTIRTRVPRIFYEDHVDRDLPAGKVIKTLTHQIDVELTWDEHQELLSDARHYSGATYDPKHYGSLIKSAQRTVAVLERYGMGDFQPLDPDEFGC